MPNLKTDKLTQHDYDEDQRVLQEQINALKRNGTGSAIPSLAIVKPSAATPQVNNNSRVIPVPGNQNGIGTLSSLSVTSDSVIFGVVTDNPATGPGPETINLPAATFPAHQLPIGPTSGADAVPTIRALTNPDLPATLQPTTGYNAHTGAAGGSTVTGGLTFTDGLYISGTATPFPNFADNEVPSGTINGINQAFTVAHAPSPTTSVHLYMSGLRITPTGNFSVSGTTITFTVAPAIGAVLLVDYRY